MGLQHYFYISMYSCVGRLYLINFLESFIWKLWRFYTLSPLPRERWLKFNFWFEFVDFFLFALQLTFFVFLSVFSTLFLKTIRCEFHNSVLFTSIVNLADWMSFIKVLNDSIPTDTVSSGMVADIFYFILVARLLKSVDNKARLMRLLLLVVNFCLKNTLIISVMWVWISSSDILSSKRSIL